MEGARLAEGGAEANSAIDRAAAASAAEVDQLRHLQDARGRSAESAPEESSRCAASGLPTGCTNQMFVESISISLCC